MILTPRDRKFVDDLRFGLREQMFKMPAGPVAYAYALTAIARALKSREDEGRPFPYDLQPVIGTDEVALVVTTVQIDVREKP